MAKITWRYLLAFAALIMLCGTSHEFIHHFTGAGLCGGFGHKTFNSFHLIPGCARNLPVVWVATMAGPLFTFGLMWAGFFMLRSPRQGLKNRGFALVFANFPVNRMFFVLLGANDEQYANRLLWGRSSLISAITVIAVWAVCLPPLIAAFRHIRGSRRILRFAAWFLLPFLFVLLLAGFLETIVLLKWKVGADEMLGIPYLILITELLSLTVYAKFMDTLSKPA